MVDYWIVEVCSKDKFSRHALDYALNELHLLNLSNINANVTSRIVLKLVVVVTDDSLSESLTLYPGRLQESHVLESFSSLVSEAESYRKYCLSQQVQAEVHIESNRYRAEGLCQVVKIFGGVKLFLDARKKVFQLRKNKTAEYCVYHLPPTCTLYKVHNSKKAVPVAGKASSLGGPNSIHSSESSQASTLYLTSGPENDEVIHGTNGPSNVNSNQGSPSPSFLANNHESTSFDSYSVAHSSQASASISVTSSLYSAPSHPSSASSSGDYFQGDKLASSSNSSLSLGPSLKPSGLPDGVAEPKPNSQTYPAVDIDLSGLDVKLLHAELKRVQEEAREAEELAKKAMNETLALQNETNILRKEASDALSMAMVQSQKQAEERDVIKKWKVDFRLFRFADLAEACNYFEAESFLGEGKTGTVYQGILEHINVAVKLFLDHPHAIQEFTDQVDVQSSIRHPNVIMILGHCEEPWSIVYEFLDNGTLRDRLRCVKATPPLPWRVRLNILIDVCKALLHLHKREPPIFSVDLNPSNILLDKNFNAKLKRVATFQCSSHNSQRTPMRALTEDSTATRTNQQTPSSTPDLHSLGLLILSLLVGIDNISCAGSLFTALDEHLTTDLEEKDPLRNFWDSTSGYWPSHIAIELARLAKESMNDNVEQHPSLINEIMPILVRLKEDANQAMEEEKRKHENVKRLTDGTPSNFLCPITWELMEEPVIASDGHTYERIAIEEWLKDHNSSPKTGLILPNKQVMANHIIHSMIEEWKELHRYSNR